MQFIGIRENRPVPLAVAIPLQFMAVSAALIPDAPPDPAVVPVQPVAIFASMPLAVAENPVQFVTVVAVMP
jgi:hypothetical protein